MREIHGQAITDAVARLCSEANCRLREDVKSRIAECLRQEISPLGRTVLLRILENARVAEETGFPLCQDTGMAVVFLRVGQEVHIEGDLDEAVQEGVRRGYREGFLRASVVGDPLRRVNTGDNTPAVIHMEIVPGDRLSITLVPKGGGSENMSEVRMLSPWEGAEGVRRFVIERITRAGANPCPPVIVGVGLGGTLESCALAAKQALLRQIGQRHPDPEYAAMETTLLEEINRLGIGPMGFGGECTALEVFIETRPCHIASLPVAVNLQCHASRHREVIL